MIFIDSNIFLDLIDPRGEWWAWSRNRIFSSVDKVTNTVVFAEISPPFNSLDRVSTFLAGLFVTIAPLTDEAAFRAGQAHAAYRRAGGPRRLPDRRARRRSERDVAHA